MFHHQELELQVERFFWGKFLGKTEVDLSARLLTVLLLFFFQMPFLKSFFY